MGHGEEHCLVAFLVSLLAVAVLVMASPHPATGLSLSELDQGMKEQSTSTITTETNNDTASLNTTTSTIESTTSDNTTTQDSTTTATTTTTTTTTTNKPESTTTTPIPTTSSSTEPDKSTSTTTLSPTEEIQLLQDTKEQLQAINDTMDKFLDLVEKTSSQSPGKGTRNHPAAWWRSNDDRFCVTDYPSCKELEDSIDKTETLISIINKEVNDWKEDNLDSLKKQNVTLSDLYIEASDHTDDFISSIDTGKFKSAVGEVQKNVEESIDTVDNKIRDLTTPPTTDTPKDNPGSVAVVAVIGSVGGLMVVGLLGATIYGGVKQRSIKKNASASPYGKIQEENIPIEGFLSDAPRPNSGYDHTSAPSHRSDPYAPPQGSIYRGPVVTRTGQGLPRTHI